MIAAHSIKNEIYCSIRTDRPCFQPKKQCAALFLFGSFPLENQLRLGLFPTPTSPPPSRPFASSRNHDVIDTTLGHRPASGVDFGLAGATTGSRPTMQQHQFRGYPQQGVPRPPAPGHHGVPPNRGAPRGGMSTYRASHCAFSFARARSLARVATSGRPLLPSHASHSP